MARDVQPLAREHQASPARYTIRSGDTLSEIAKRFCGTTARYPNLAAANNIPDPDLIITGRQIAIACQHAALRAVRQPAPHARADSHGRVWGKSFGYPNKCGDGDGDGWDVSCAKLQHGGGSNHGVSVARPAARTESVRGFSHAGTLSFSGLEQLWVSAGGPSWAMSSAARVAECESGGRQYAHNPSGASGYWQILGQVVGGNVYDPMTNARNAVAKFKASGSSWAQWVCKP